MSRQGVNFMVLMRDASGRVVPESIRLGHNVMTLAGRDHLTRLAVWSAFGTTDTAFTGRRARWVGVGSGFQLEVEEVVHLAAPLAWTTGSKYLKAMDPALTVFPTLTSVRMKTVFGPTDITYASSAVVVSEAGLFFDAVAAGTGELDDTSPDNVPIFYKSFEPLVKLDGFSLEILWELRF